VVKEVWAIGWTLVELLIVVAIISVLAALTMRTLPAVRQAVDRATCANGQRVWKTNIAMQELTVADRSMLAKCWQCHPQVP
jgi:prepilin-type N-terminal cleavage/methylation domain-containing protein